MAAKKKTKSRRSKPASAPKDPIARIVRAALDEAAAVGWRQVGMDAVARRAGMTLGDVLMHVPTKGHIVARLADHIDMAMVKDAALPDRESSPRDRLFEILMRRFDALQVHRDGIKALLKDAARDPGLAAMGLVRLSRSMAVALSAAGISADGLIGCARVHGLKLVQVSALRAWMNDDSDDMAKTMAALDKALNLAERAASMSKFRMKRPGRQAA
ncbi:MAG: hypothetical protein KDE14_13610 [Rhodobacteraceae bacterium]|nr:hypothetical protein [Paracoccaceae bacterium]